MNLRLYRTLQAIRLFFVRREKNALQGEKYFFPKKFISVSNVQFAAWLPKVVMT